MKFNAKRYTEEQLDGIWIFKKKFNVYVGKYDIELEQDEWKVIRHLIKSESFNKLKNDENFLRYSADGSYFLASHLDYRGSTGYTVPTDEASIRQFGYWIWNLRPSTSIEIKAHSATARVQWEDMFINNFKKIKYLAEKKYEIDNKPENESIEI